MNAPRLDTPSEPTVSRAAHRAAWVLACATFPLIWMGGLVTTYAAGMAVPDWPSTYGYNLFLYPLASWLKVWDVFLEHGHRLLGSAVGLSTIALAVLVWRRDRRPIMWYLAAIAVGGVCVQGTLGGLRVTGAAIQQAKIAWIPAPLFLASASALFALVVQVVLSGRERRGKAGFWLRVAAVAAAFFFLARLGVDMARDQIFLAKMHGCTAPAFFALAAALVVLTSPRWTGTLKPVETPRAPRVRRLAAASAGLIYVQIVLGANLRHVAPDAAPWWFTLWIWLHVIVALALLAVIVWQWLATRKCQDDQNGLERRVLLLAGLFLAQLALGVATWVTNYGWPLWFTNFVFPLEYTVIAEGLWQALSTTAHVAVGSLCLATATSAGLWSWRLLRPPSPPKSETRPTRTAGRATAKKRR